VAAREVRSDIGLLDIEMPGLDGLDAVETLADALSPRRSA
jgi:DNA-binding NarL/FixJ family response regulator